VAFEQESARTREGLALQSASGLLRVHKEAVEDDPGTGPGAGSDTACGCTVGASAASDDGTGATGFADTAGRGADDAVGPVVDALVDGERAAPVVGVAVAAGDDRAAGSGKAVADVTAASKGAINPPLARKFAEASQSTFSIYGHSD